MDTVKKSSLGLIKSVFNSNTDNTQHYGIISKMFNGKVEKLEFAKPIIQSNSGYILWKANTPGPYIQFSELKDENKKKSASNMVQSALKTIEQRAKDFNQSTDFIDKIIELPSEESIFFTKNNESISVILTEWGYTNDEFIKGEGVLRRVFPASLQSFIIHFKNSNNEPVSNVSCEISLNGHTTRYISDEKGIITLNDMTFNDVLTIESSNNQFGTRSVDISERKEEVIIIDEEEIFAPQGELEEDLEDEFIEFIESPEESNNNVLIEILNWKKKPIENHSLSFYGEKDGKNNYTTDSKGQFHLNSLEQNKEYSIFMEFKNSDWKQDFTHSNSNNKYTFIVKKRKFLWWWIPLIIGFFLLLSLIPTEVNHHFTVYDNQTKKPLAGSLINNQSGYQSQAIESTNQEGKLSINFGTHTIFSQFFSGFDSQFSVTKNGYESLINEKLPISFFRTNKSEVYLDPISIDTVYKTTEPSPINKSDCNSGGDADDSGGNSIKEYDMSQNSGQFVFDYNTGLKIPDIINIYDCSISNINSSKLIWSFNNYTGGDAHETIKFNNRIITVEVIGGGNINSVWSYRVNCPDN